MNLRFNVAGSYSEADKELTDFLNEGIRGVKVNDLPEYKLREEFIEEVTEAFFERFDKFPTKLNLWLLSSLLLLEHIKDRNPHKIKEENAFLSPRQLRKRYSMELCLTSDVMDALVTRQVHKIAVPKNTKELEA